MNAGIWGLGLSYTQSCSSLATFAELTAGREPVSVKFRALGGAMQDAPLALLFVSGIWVSFLVSGLTHFFAG